MAVLRSYRRFVVVARYFLPLILAYVRDRHRFVFFGPSRSVDPETQRERAEYLLDTLLTLGPTFIKLGQLLSTRPDILPPAYVDVLAQLQDDVPPADWDRTKAVIEDEIGPVEDRFDHFDTNAISGASLGQVYRAEIDGEPVAVKVRRPDVKGLVEADLRVIKWSVPLLVRFLDEARSFSLRNLADEFDRTIREEMDYARERRILNEIRANFEDEQAIRIPQAIESHSADRVLTMEYIEGTKITETETLDERGIDRTALAETLQRAYLKMIIKDGTFHADPHPGNLAVTDDGKIIFYDFGMSGTVDEYTQDKIVDFYVAIANQDIDAILDAWVAIGALSPNADREVMAEVIELAIQDARGEEIEQYRVQEIIGDVEDSLYEFPFRLPRDLALVLRVATVVEGVCVTLDQDFDFIEVATDYLTEQGYREETARRVFSELGKQFQSMGGAALRVLPKVEDALDEVNRGTITVEAELTDPEGFFKKLAKRIVLSVLIATGFLSTALLYTFESAGSAAIAALGTAIVMLVLYRSFRSSGSVSMQTQFTRQSMRQQDREE